MGRNCHGPKWLWAEMISYQIKVANRNLGLIFRTFTYIDKDIFLNLFKSIVRPHIEYASSVWSPVFKKDMIALENVQRRATKLVKSIAHLSYSDRLRKLGLPSLEYRRKGRMLYKSIKSSTISTRWTKVSSSLALSIQQQEVTR